MSLLTHKERLTWLNVFFFFSFNIDQQIIIFIIKMSSPGLRNKSSSPIRYLDDRSPKRLLSVIKEQEFLNQSSSKYYPSYISNNSLSVNQKMQFPYVYNSQQKSEALIHEIYMKDAEIDGLKKQIILMGENHLTKMQKLSFENTCLRKQIESQNIRSIEDAEKLRQKYSALVAEDSNLSKKTYIEDITRLLKDIEVTNHLLKEKQTEISHLTSVNHMNSQNYSQNLQGLITENNLLRNQLNYCEFNKNYEVKEAQSKKQLEKSRTKGIIQFCKQSNTYLEKQMTKLAEQLLQKNISIESFTKELLKQRRTQENIQKQYQGQLNRAQDSHINEVRQLHQTIRKLQKHYKEEIGDQKNKEIKLLQNIATLEHENQNIQRQLDHTKDLLAKKENELQFLKNSVDQLREEHSREISKVMNDSRIKRKSMKNISSLSSSSKDLSYTDLANTSKPSFIQRKQSIQYSKIIKNQQGLAVVQQQELAQSYNHNKGQDQDDQHQIKQLVYHYETMLREHKSNKDIELGIAYQKINKLQRSLQDKQKDFLQILQKFSPLMELKILLQKNQKPLEEQRNQKIKSHYKADLDLLSVLLDKNQIQALRKYRPK